MIQLKKLHQCNVAEDAHIVSKSSTTIPRNKGEYMDNKDMRGAIIRGVMAMQTPVIMVFFKECCADDFQANWDDLTSGVQQFWIELAEQLEGIIGLELWKNTIDEWSKDYSGKKCKHFGRCNHETGDDWFEKEIKQLYSQNCPSCHCTLGSNKENCEICCNIVRIFPPQIKDLCTGCASENCSHMWKWGKKCCNDCSHVKPLACPICKLELKPSPSGLICANGHGH